MSTKTAWHALWALAALVLASLACTINIGGPTPPAPLPTADPAALQSLRAGWQTAIAQAQDGHVRVTVTEAQLTALLADKLAREQNAWFQQPAVFLREDKIEIYGQVHKANVVAPVRITLSVSIAANGQPAFHLEHADFGPLPVPSDLLEGLSTMLNEAFTGKVGPLATGIRVEEVTIEQGVMTVQGSLR